MLFGDWHRWAKRRIGDCHRCLVVALPRRALPVAHGLRAICSFSCASGGRFCVAPTVNGKAGDVEGRILALDLGKRRIGLAVSDELGITAQGIETLERTNLREDLARLAHVVEEKQVSLILIGNPIRMNGSEGRQSDWARQFAQKLGARTGCAVKLWDERLTTVEAERVLYQSGVSRQKRKKAVDRLAAVILLESYLAAAAAVEERVDPAQ